jgi:hypothetical protein
MMQSISMRATVGQFGELSLMRGNSLHLKRMRRKLKDAFWQPYTLEQPAQGNHLPAEILCYDGKGGLRPEWKRRMWNHRPKMIDWRQEYDGDPDRKLRDYWESKVPLFIGDDDDGVDVTDEAELDSFARAFAKYWHGLWAERLTMTEKDTHFPERKRKRIDNRPWPLGSTNKPKNFLGRIEARREFRCNKDAIKALYEELQRSWLIFFPNFWQSCALCTPPGAQLLQWSREQHFFDCLIINFM